MFKYSVGDSIGEGVVTASQQTSSPLQSVAVQGASPDAILARIETMDPKDVQGASIFLSSGVSNAWKNPSNPNELNNHTVDTVKKEIDALLARGAGHVTLSGVSNELDGLKNYNTVLKQIAADPKHQGKVSFVDLPSTDKDPAHVHPFGHYNDLLGNAQAQLAVSGNQVAAAKTESFGDHMLDKWNQIKEHPFEYAQKALTHPIKSGEAALAFVGNQALSSVQQAATDELGSIGQQLGLGGGNTPSTGQGTGTPSAGSDQKLPWYQRALAAVGLGNTPSSDSSSGDDSTAGGGIGGFFQNLMKNPITAIIGLVVGLIMAVFSGAGSLLSGIGSFFGFGRDDAPGGGIVNRVETAASKGLQTLEHFATESSLGQVAKDVGHSIVHGGETFVAGVAHDFNVSKSTLQKANYAVDYLVNHEGIDKVHAIGMVANYVAESGLNPNSKGDGGAAFGIGQWHSDRQANFEKWSGHSIQGSSIEQQLSFAAYEVRQGGEKAAGMKLASTSNVGDAAAAYCASCERPADKVGQSNSRAALAQKILTSYDSQQQGVTVSSAAPLNTPSQLRPAHAIGG